MEIENESLNITIPSFGKTGTANRFTNSSFVGLIPGPKEDSGHLDIQEGYVIASYVGYDDNRPMKGQFITIYGASGALPLWIDTANAIANSHDYKKNLQIADLAFDSQSAPLINNKELRPIIISSKNGLPIERQDEELSDNHIQVFSYAGIKEGELRLERLFEPF